MIDAKLREMEEKRNQVAQEDIPKENERVGLNDIAYDTDYYSGDKSKFEGYHTSLPADDQDEEDDQPLLPKRGQITAPTQFLKEAAQAPDDFDPMAEYKRPKIVDREDEYRRRRQNQVLSPMRIDPFANGGATPDVGARGYANIMRDQQLKADQADYEKQMKERAKEGTLKVVDKQAGNGAVQASAPKRRGRWDMTSDETPSKAIKKTSGSTTPTASSSGYSSGTSDHTSSTPAHLQPWDATPGHKDLGSETPGAGIMSTPRMWDATPAHVTPGHTGSGSETPAAGAAFTPGRRNRWDETPRTERETPGHGAGWAETPRADKVPGEKIISETPTPSASKRRSRWDETPSATPGGATPSGAATPSATPSGATPSMNTPSGTPSAMMTPSMGTPMGPKAMAMATPSPSQMMQMTPEQLQAYRWEQEIDSRNRPLSDEELDAMFPPGYKVLQPPAGYIPIRTPSRKLSATPTPMVGQTPTGFYMQPDTPAGQRGSKLADNQPKDQNLPFLKPEDAQYFDKLLVEVDEDTLSPEELKERQIMELLLKIKNGTPPMRKSALRRITDKARHFGAGPLFNQILPLLMSPTLEDQERHLLVKVIGKRKSCLKKI